MIAPLLVALVSLESHRVLIGNYLTTAPSGIAFIVDDTAAFVIDTGAPYAARPCAPDGAYNLIEYQVGSAKVRLVWGRREDGARGVIASDAQVRVPLKLIQSWPGWLTTYAGASDGATGTSSGISWQIHFQPQPVSANGSEIVVEVGPNRPAYFSAGIGTVEAPRMDREHGGQLLFSPDLAEQHYQLEGIASIGAWGNFLGAIAANLNNSRIYSNDNHMLAHTVSRGWASSPNTAPYFCWDSFFNGNLASLEDPKTARDTVRAILSCQTAEGLVPNFGHWNFAGGGVSTDRSQPPVGSMCIWKMHQRWPDVGFLKEVYPKLVRWHNWWPTARDGNHNGLLEWGSATGELQGAKWETGWDDTVHFEGAKMVGHNMDADAVDLNSMWAMDAENLALIADAIGRHSEAKALRKEHREICDRINRELWNPELGIYCSKLWSGQFLTRLTPMNFYPLIAGVPDQERANRVLAVMADPKRFWGDWILPTVAYEDPVWPKQDYWRGKVWAPVNYLVYQGLLRYAPPEILNRFASRSVALFMRNWTAKGVCGENYLSSTGEQSSDPHYTWGALLCLIGLENIVHLESDGRIWLNGTLNADASMANVPLNGRRYDVIVKPGETQIFKRGSSRSVLEARGTIVRSKL